jgi:prepilin-type N-terminal cleavage/methylation domain-containing protein
MGATMSAPQDYSPNRSRARRFPFRRRRPGFSLVEVMLAMVVLGIVLMTLISVFIYGYNVMARSKQLAIATQVCRAEIERIRGLAFDSLDGLGSAFTDPMLAALIDGQGIRAVEAGAGSDMRKLTVSVNWIYRGLTMRKDVVTFITRMGVNKK